MVDGIQFNPFTGQVLTPDEIQRMDLNKDNVITQDELRQGMAWLSGGQDTDGEVQIGEQSQLTQAALKSGMSESAKDESELKANIAILQDEFIEHFFKENTGLSSEERTNIIALVSTATTSFVSSYLTENPQGPYDMTDVASKYEINIKTTLDNNRKATDAVKASIDGYINNVDSNYDAMLSYANSALVDENDIVKGTEWNQVKNKAVQYLMGSLMSGNIDVDLLTNINPNYAKNSNYQEALKAINELKNCSDPAKMQQLLTTAQQKLAAFLDGVGAQKVTTAIQDTEKAKQEAAITTELNKQIDSWVESKITKDMSSEEKEIIQKFAQNAIGKFLAKLAEEDRLDSNNMKSIVAEFNKYINKQYTEYTKTQNEIDTRVSNTQATYDNLVKLSDKAKKSGNVSNEEKEKIVDAGANLILQQMMNGCEEIELLAALNPSYKSNADFIKLKSIITQIKTSVDVDEIKKLGEQALELMKNILDKYSGNKLADAVDATKPLEVNTDTKTSAIYNSEIGADYQADVSRCTGYGKQNEESLKEIQNLAKQDIEKYAKSLKAQLKAQLGAGYDEAEIDKYIQDAMNDTIALFTQGATRRQPSDYPDAGKYTTTNTEYKFVFQRNKKTKKGRYIYNVQALIDTFTAKFNETAKLKHGAKLDPSQATYDKENVIANSVGNEYLRDEKIDYEDTTENRVKAINEAKQYLVSISQAIKASLQAEGCNIPDSDIQTILDESLLEMINDITSIIDNGKYEKREVLFGKRKFGKWLTDWLKKDTDKFSISKKELADTFMKKIDAKLDEYKGKKTKESESEEK